MRVKIMMLLLIGLLIGWMGKAGITDVNFEALLLQHSSLTVCPEGPPVCQFAKIQEAIDTAPPKATIEVAPGIYVENLVLYKEVLLKGAGAEQTILQAAREGLPAVLIVPRGGSITGFTITGAKDAAGIQIYGQWYSAGIFRNIITGNNRSGIQVIGDITVYITDNFISDNGDIGLWIRHLGDWRGLGGECWIRRNQILNHSEGILIWDSHNVMILENTIRDNKEAGIRLRDSSGVHIVENAIEGTKDGAALHGFRVGFSPVGGVDIRIAGNIIQKNKKGIDLLEALAWLWRNQVFNNHGDGIAVGSPSTKGRLHLEENIVVDNSGYGVRVDSLDIVETCRGNLVSSNQQGDYVVGSPPQPSPELKAKCEGADDRTYDLR